MNKVRKDAFLILRIPTEWKTELSSRAKKSETSLSQYIRECIQKILNG